MPLDKKDGIGAWIKDFQSSDAPQFKGHSKEKRRDQAIAAYLSAKKEGLEEAKKMPINPHRNLTKQQSRALSSAAARAKPKSQVSLAPAPWDKKKKEKKEMYGMSSSVMKRKRPSMSTEGTWHYPDTKQIAILRNMMKNPIKLGKEGDDAMDSIPIGDDELHDQLYLAGKKKPNGDARPILKKWFARRIKDNSYGLGAKTKQLANKIGLKEGTYNNDGLYETTNWKGGSQQIGLARYSARNGYGVQITQIKPMPGDKMNWANGAGFVKLPVKDIPKLCKALMNVYKAPANLQVGDDD